MSVSIFRYASCTAVLKHHKRQKNVTLYFVSVVLVTVIIKAFPCNLSSSIHFTSLIAPKFLVFVPIIKIAPSSFITQEFDRIFHCLWTARCHFTMSAAFCNFGSSRVVQFSQQAGRHLSLYNIHWLVLLIKERCVFCETKTKSLHTVHQF
jgi:hypothetical protein